MYESIFVEEESIPGLYTAPFSQDFIVDTELKNFFEVYFRLDHTKIGHWPLFTTQRKHRARDKHFSTVTEGSEDAESCR